MGGQGDRIQDKGEKEGMMRENKYVVEYFEFLGTNFTESNLKFPYMQ